MLHVGHETRFTFVLRRLHRGLHLCDRVTPRVRRFMLTHTIPVLRGPVVVERLRATPRLRCHEAPDEIHDALEHPSFSFVIPSADSFVPTVRFIIAKPEERRKINPQISPEISPKTE